MSRTSFLTIGIIVLFVLNAVTLFMLFRMNGHPPGPEKNGEGPAKFIIEQLNLNEKQQQQFADLRNQHQQNIKKIHEDERRLHDEYFELLKSDNPDKARVDSLATLMAQGQKQMELTTFEHFQQLRAICRDDQKKLFDNTVDDIAKMVGQPGPRPGGPPAGGPPPLRRP